MKPGLIVIGLILIVGGLLGFANREPFTIVERRDLEMTQSLPADRRNEPLDVQSIDPRVAAWACLFAGTVSLVTGCRIKRSRPPEPRD